MLCSIADAGAQYEIHILCDAPEAKTACRQNSLPPEQPAAGENKS